MGDIEARGRATPLRFGVVAPIRTDLSVWRDQVRRSPNSGYSTLLMPDVAQWQPAPGPTLAVAATLVADLRVGTCGVRVTAAPGLEYRVGSTLTVVLTEGRFEIEIGTGRTRDRDDCAQRSSRS